MPATLQTQAVQVANNLIGIAQTLYQLQDQINLNAAQFMQLTLGSVFTAMATCASNADGSLGAADAAPAAGHVIDTRVVTGLSRAVSANDLATLNTLLQSVATLLSGAAVTQQGESPQLLNKLIGG